MSPRYAEAEPGVTHQQMLLRKLLHAFYWVDDGLQAHMVRETGVSLPRAQSMMMACIDDGITRQSDIARHLRVSKQAVQQALKALIAKGLVRVEPDPDNGRQKIVLLTARGDEMRRIAREGIRALEHTLAERIGQRRFEALQEALDANWGPVGAADQTARRGAPGSQAGGLLRKRPVRLHKGPTQT